MEGRFKLRSCAAQLENCKELSNFPALQDTVLTIRSASQAVFLFFSFFPFFLVYFRNGGIHNAKINVYSVNVDIAKLFS